MTSCSMAGSFLSIAPKGCQRKTATEPAAFLPQPLLRVWQEGKLCREACLAPKNLLVARSRRDFRLEVATGRQIRRFQSELINNCFASAFCAWSNILGFLLQGSSISLGGYTDPRISEISKSSLIKPALLYSCGLLAYSQAIKSFSRGSAYGQDKTSLSVG